VAIALAGCGGGDDEPSRTFGPADVDLLATVAPTTPGWPAWPDEPEPKQPSSESPDEAAASDPIYAEFRRKTAHLSGESDDTGASNKRKGDDKLANLVVEVVDTPADAHKVFLASNDLSLGYGDLYGDVGRRDR
jgi:hypothetical protein